MDWESPKLLLLILPAVALLLWIESRSLHPVTGLRKRLLLVVRAIGGMLAIAGLAGPAQVTQTGRKALGIVVDASQSMGEEGLAKSMAEAERVQKALGGDIDSFVVQLGSEPALLPEGGTAAMQAEWQKKNGSDSHYAAAIEYAEAMFPPGVSRNILLIGDGHETRGSLLAAAREAAVSGITLHALPVAGLPPLRATQPRAEVAHLRQWHAGHGAARPVFQLALRWLDDHAPADGVATLVHGDFRNGNLMVDLAAPGGALVGVLDWELAHLGDPMADLGWVCVHSWRFGQLQRPVGGFGSLDALLDGYASAGGEADRARIHWWQVLGTLRWGVICESMGQAWRTGAEPVMEKAAISRRASETEIDLLALLLPRTETA